MQTLHQYSHQDRETVYDKLIVRLFVYVGKHNHLQATTKLLKCSNLVHLFHLAALNTASPNYSYARARNRVYTNVFQSESLSQYSIATGA